jgi:hypothetical protein
MREQVHAKGLEMMRRTAGCGVLYELYVMGCEGGDPNWELGR